MKSVNELLDIKLTTRARCAAEDAMRKHAETIGLVKDLERINKFMADFCHDDNDDTPHVFGRYYRSKFNRADSKTISTVLAAKQASIAKQLERYLSEQG